MARMKFRKCKGCRRVFKLKTSTARCDRCISFGRLKAEKHREENKKNRGQAEKQKIKYLSSQKFLESTEWKALRFEAFLKHGRVCQCCGQRPPQVALHVDHVKPRSLFPLLANDINNLQVLCEDCNFGKSNKFATDFRAPID